MNPESLSLSGPHHAAECEVAAVVANWHDRTHQGAFSMCQEQPCLASRSADHGSD